MFVQKSRPRGAKTSASSSLNTPTRDDSSSYRRGSSVDSSSSDSSSNYADSLNGGFDDQNSKKNNNAKYQTELCQNWEEKGQCCYGDQCRFAHGKDEMMKQQQKNRNYKTTPCHHFFNTGMCSYGIRCAFQHDVRTPNEIASQNYFQKIFHIVQLVDRQQLNFEYPEFSLNQDFQIKQQYPVQQQNYRDQQLYKEIKENDSNQSYKTRVTGRRLNVFNLLTNGSSTNSANSNSINNSLNENEERSNSIGLTGSIESASSLSSGINPNSISGDSQNGSIEGDSRAISGKQNGVNFIRYGDGQDTECDF